MQKSELELIIETIPDAVTVVDSSGNITFANRAAEIILGVNRSEIKERTYNAPSWKITTPEGKPFPEEELPFARVMKLKKPVYGIEHAIEHPGGKRVILSINASPLLDEKDDVKSMVASFTDITDRKMVEIALKESERRFRELLKEIDLVAAILDTNGRIKFANDYILELAELTWDLVENRDFFDVFIAQDQKEKAKERFLGALTKGAIPERIELDIETFEGERRTISFSNTIIRDAGGNIAGIASIGEDITEQKRAAEEIRESRRQVLDILESITDAFYALDNEWRFTYVNHRAEELLGVRREHLLFRNIWQIIRKEQSPKMYENFHQAKAQMNPTVFEEDSLRPNKWLEIYVYPYQNGLSVYIRDITDRKQAEQVRATNLHFLESMDQVNRAILATSDLEQMMSNVLDVVLKVFNCDRTFLLYPCDPETQIWTVPMERTRPKYPGVLALGIEMPIDPDVAATFKILLDSDGPVRFGPESEYPLPEDVAKKFNFKSFMGMAIYPKLGKPWEFGLHQCTYPRVWTPEEMRLFQEIGRRIQDGLSSFLANRELQESRLELRRSNDLLEAIIEAAPVSIMGLDLDGNVQMVWNPAAEKMLGWSKEEVIGHHLPSVAPEKEEEFAEFRERIRRGLTLDGVEVRRRRRDGTPIDYSIYAAPLHDPEGRIIGNIAILVDITERKRSEEQITLLNFALDHVHESAFLINEDARLLYVNEEVSRALGYNRDELLGGMTVLDVDVEMNEEGWLRHWEELKDQGTIIFERLHKTKDGRIFPVEVNANSFYYKGVSYNLALVRDITERKQKERFDKALNDINAIISSTLDFDKSMEYCLPLAIDTLGVESASVIMPEHGEWVIKHRFPKAFIGRHYSNEDAPHLVLASDRRAPVSIDDTYNDPRIDPKVMYKYADRAKLVAPLVVGKELTGLLVFGKREPTIFSIDQIDFSTKVATSVYFALENARLFETERDIADTLQEALMTIPKHIRGIEYGYLYRSATEAAKVGGDFFDIFELKDGKVGVIVGDISGKGLQAASLTAVVKSIVRAYAYEETSPAIVMKKANETVKRAIPAPYFITLFLGIIDIERGIITYCSAGHPPALIKRGNSVEQLQVLSPIVGAFAGIDYTQSDVAINPDDILVLYTDGITEARFDGEFFGEERLERIVESLTGVSVKDIPHDIFKKVMDFTGGKLTDDVVLLSLALQAGFR